MPPTVRALLLLLATATVAAGQAKFTNSGTRQEPMSGKQLYTSYRALCHGAEARGGGTFSPQLKIWPPDLTQIAKKNKGVFPTMHVRESIDGEFQTSPHGSSEMPIWGPVFRSMAHGHDDSAQVRVNTLVSFIESLQQK